MAGYEICGVRMIHSGAPDAVCVLTKEHLASDTDHEDKHGCHAPVLVRQSTIREMEALAESDRQERDRKRRATLAELWVMHARNALDETMCGTNNQIGLAEWHTDGSSSFEVKTENGEIIEVSVKVVRS